MWVGVGVGVGVCIYKCVIIFMYLYLYMFLGIFIDIWMDRCIDIYISGQPKCATPPLYCAQACVYFIADASDAVTGQSISIDGGLTMP